MPPYLWTPSLQGCCPGHWSWPEEKAIWLGPQRCPSAKSWIIGTSSPEQPCCWRRIISPAAETWPPEAEFRRQPPREFPCLLLSWWWSMKGKEQERHAPHLNYRRASLCMFCVPKGKTPLSPGSPHYAFFARPSDTNCITQRIKASLYLLPE